MAKLPGGRAKPVTKADKALSVKHARRSVKEDSLRIRQHKALAKKERRNRRAYAYEMGHIRRHAKDKRTEQRYIKALRKVRVSKR